MEGRLSFSAIADTDGPSFLEFFRSNRETGRAKGIVTMDLGVHA